MPPYSSSSPHVFDDHITGSNPYNDHFVDIPLGASSATTVTATTTTTTKQQKQGQETIVEENETRSSSILEKLLDFNPCMNMGRPVSFTMHNPTSAVFKNRVCYECGRKCTLMQGYDKEVIEKTVLVPAADDDDDADDDDEEETGNVTEVKEDTKIYHHKWCSQIKAYRQEHKLQNNGGYELVMRNLLDYFRALELEAQIKRDAEIRRVNRALRIATERRLVEEEQIAAAKAVAESELQSKHERNASFEVSLMKKKPSLMKRIKKVFSTKNKRHSCAGNNATIDAVDNKSTAHR